MAAAVAAARGAASSEDEAPDLDSDSDSETETDTDTDPDREARRMRAVAVIETSEPVRHMDIGAREQALPEAPDPEEEATFAGKCWAKAIPGTYLGPQGLSPGAEALTWQAYPHSLRHKDT